MFRKNGERDTPTRDYVIDRADFLEWRNSIWEIKPESSKRTKHVAPFPMELPRRLITLYSFESELVLDPFLGSGTTLRAAKLLNRKGIGFEHDAKYFELAKRNLAQYKMDGF